MADQKRLAYSIIQFLHTQLQNGSMSPDAQESLEGMLQFPGQLSSLPLAELCAISMDLGLVLGFIPAFFPLPSRAFPTLLLGNDQMKAENFEAAVSFYGKAIELNPANAVYFCNRAAAYSKLGNYAGAVRDCERAIGIDPNYSKAYGRMGLALSSLNKHTEAVVYYKKALELDPDNETYKSNLKIAEQKMKETPSPTGGPGGFDLAGLLNNPGFMSMVIPNPSRDSLAWSLSSVSPNGFSQSLELSGSCTVSPCVPRGQQFAQQMQQQNPELIEQLRSQIRSRTPSASNEEQQE
ncbi:SGTA protein, partial [Corvus moneduloides]|nr:SGTA protein [Corvus moneduloides]